MNTIAGKDLKYILDHTEGLWENLRNKSIFLTGGTGFFGKWLSESFVYVNNILRLNASLLILSRDPERFLQNFPSYKSEPSVTFIKGDILNFEFPEGDCDYVIHAATEADAALNNAQPLLMLDTITAGTRRLLDFALHKGVDSFLFTSSGAVYGKQPAEVSHVKEGQYFSLDVNNPHNAYAEGKRVAELYCSIYYTHNNLPVKIARCFAFVGPYLPLDKHFAVGNFLHNAINKEDIIIKGDGTPYRSYLYAADLAICLWKILFNGLNNQPYNVGSDEDYSLETIAKVIASLTPGIAVRVLSEPDPSKPVERYVPDVTFLKSTLHKDRFLNLEEALERSKSFYGEGQFALENAGKEA